MFMVNNAKYVKAGEVLLTSAVDITGEGWQDVTFNQFGQRALTGLATMAATDFISKQFNKTPELSIEQKVDNSIKDAIESGNALDRNGLTKSGRALQKHGSRPGSVFPKIPGKSLNAEGQNILGEILNSSSKVDVPNRFGGSDIFDLITGRGARFDANNNFMGFLEP